MTICIRLVVLAIALNTCLSVHLAVDRNASLKHGIPFWCALSELAGRWSSRGLMLTGGWAHRNYFNSMVFGGKRDPTEAQIRWQVFTSLAYGAKGVLYFCCESDILSHV